MDTDPTPNKFFVSGHADKIRIMRPPVQDLSRDDALNLAAWLVALTDKDEFEKVFKQVMST